MSQVDVRIDDGIAVITLNNPPYGFIDRGTVADLDTAVAVVETAHSVRAVVITGGVEGVFAAHYSVQELESLGRHLRDHGPGPVPVADELAALLARIEASPHPWIAAINGTCMGAGLELALACDLRIVEDDDYSIGLPEANIGLTPGAGGTQRLPRLIGTARALELILMGRMVSPIQAVQLGIAQELAPDLAIHAAMIMARRLADQPAAAVAHIKRLVRGAATTPLAEGLANERAAFVELLAGDEPIALMTELNEGERDIRD